MYKSVRSQMIHYLSRPDEGVIRTPLTGDAAWKGSDFAGSDDWQDRLTEPQVREIEQAIRIAKATGKPTAKLTKKDFPLPTLTRKINEWRSIVDGGRGFALIKGIPVDRWGEADCELFFWCFGLHLGVPGAQNPQGDLLGHVRNIGLSPKDNRFYQTNAALEFHADAADVVGLLCMHGAKSGGASRIVSSVSIYNELLSRRPELIDRLYQPFLVDTKGEGGLNFFPVPACAYADGRLRTFYIADYFRSYTDHLDAPPLSMEDRALLDLYDEIAATEGMYLDMNFEPGDIQLLSNHSILHARTAYEEYSEPKRRRHLLRLWLSLPKEAPLPTRVRLATSRVRAVGVFARAKVEHELWRAGLISGVKKN
ncbi:MAG: TauD/TfdA family dioxygenase [Myxococcota bacterium]